MSSNQDFYFWNGGLKGVANFMAGNIYGDSDLDLKMTHDAYDVFVNGEFVGTRVSTSNDGGAKAVTDMLKSRGYDDIEVEVQGDHIELRANDRHQADQVKGELDVWLHID